MEEQKRNDVYKGILGIGFALFLISNIVTGFRESSVYEELSLIIIVWGILGDVLSNVTVVKHNHLKLSDKFEEKLIDNIYGDIKAKQENGTL